MPTKRPPNNPTVVSIDRVIPQENYSSWHVRAMMRVLQKQGQIEPLQVQLVENGYQFRTFSQDAYGTDIVYAAQNLSWPTLLVVVNEKYEA